MSPSTAWWGRKRCQKTSRLLKYFALQQHENRHKGATAKIREMMSVSVLAWSGSAGVGLMSFGRREFDSLAEGRQY